MTLYDLFDRYKAKRLLFRSKNTIRLYEHTLRAFAATIGHSPTIEDLTSDKVELHMSRIINKGGSPASANKDRSQLLALWRFAAVHKIVASWPEVQQITEPEQVPMGWMPEEIEKLFESAAKEKQMIGNVQGAIWWTALFHTLLATGERIGAILQVEPRHYQGYYLLVPAACRKGCRRDRLYSLHEQASVALMSLRKQIGNADRLFPFPYSSTYVYKRLNIILKRAGLPSDRKSKFHRMRKTVASAVARAGGDPTAALDHASPKTTKKYLDPRIVGDLPVSDILAAYLAHPEKKDRRSGHDRRQTG